MKKSALRLLDPNSPEYVIAHARFQRSRGKKPSMAYAGEANPARALKLAHAGPLDPLTPEQVTKLKPGSQYWCLSLCFTEPLGIDRPFTVVLHGKDYSGNQLLPIVLSEYTLFGELFRSSRFITDMTRRPNGVFLSEVAAQREFKRLRKQYESDKAWQADVAQGVEWAKYISSYDYYDYDLEEYRDEAYN